MSQPKQTAVSPAQDPVGNGGSLGNGDPAGNGDPTDDGGSSDNQDPAGNGGSTGGGASTDNEGSEGDAVSSNNAGPAGNGDLSSGGGLTNHAGSGGDGGPIGNGGSSGSGDSAGNGALMGSAGSSGDEGSTTGSQDPENPGSLGSDPDDLQSGGLLRTTVQLGSQPSAKAATIHLGGSEEHHTQGSDSANQDPIAPFVIAPFASTPKSAYPVVTVAGQKLTIANPSAVSIGSTVITPGGLGVDVEGTSVSLGPSGNLVMGDYSRPHPGSSLLTIAGNTFTANPISFDIVGTPVTAGGSETTVSGVAVRLGSSGNLVLGDGTGAVNTNHPSLFTVGSVTFTANPTAFAVGRTTVTAGGPDMTLANTLISLDPLGSLVVGSSTIALQTPAPAILTKDGQTATFQDLSQVAFAGKTLTGGGLGISVSGTPISVGPSGLAIGSNIIPPPVSSLSVITTDGLKFTFAQQSQIAVDGTTLSIGGPGLTASGTPVSVGSGGLIIGSDTITPLASTPTIMTTIGQTVTFELGGLVALDGTTLSVGGDGATICGTPVTVGTSRLVNGSDAIALPSPTSVLTTNGETVTFESKGQVAVDGVTLSAKGPAATVSGVSMSVGSSNLFVGTDTIPLPSGDGSATSTIDAFTGTGSNTKAISLTVCWGLLMVLMVVL